MTTKACDGIIARPARESDVPVLAAMAGEFKVYLDTLGEPGDAPEPTALTAEALRRDGFGDDPWFNVLLAERAGAPVGYLLYYFGYWPDRAARALVVADLFVREAARGQGVGTVLMTEATRILCRRGGKLVLWTVWDRNPAAIAFYRSLGVMAASDEILMMWPDTAWPPA